MIYTLGFLSRKDIRHVSLVLGVCGLDVLDSRGILKLVGHVDVRRFSLSGERHVCLVIALRSTRLVLVHRRVHADYSTDVFVCGNGIFLKAWPNILD